ncbi:hypothetical protein [Burkholderia lata]|uniref:hypothetical protein n=1 Tax=Burkholderia lata (strain ATCC 17760 / DSM 23089 / LMG 22485 / NCIMB 9086 / R18194 / 383) TaxID=482957 RepID=UPI0015814D7A|nr:hypothetical protein [Burkholderia lata]
MNARKPIPLNAPQLPARMAGTNESAINAQALQRRARITHCHRSLVFGKTRAARRPSPRAAGPRSPSLCRSIAHFGKFYVNTGFAVIWRNTAAVGGVDQAPSGIAECESAMACRHRTHFDFVYVFVTGIFIERYWTFKSSAASHR